MIDVTRNISPVRKIKQENTPPKHNGSCLHTYHVPVKPSPPPTFPAPACKGRPSTYREWALYIQSLIEPGDNPFGDEQTLVSELAKPYSLDAPLILHHKHHNAQEYPRSAKPTPDFILREPSRYPDLFLWWALTDCSLDPLPLIDLRETNALFPQDRFTTIEVWTETELAALHALSHHAALLQQAELDTRIRNALDWHIENTQPDNATNHPWAVNAFILRNTPEAIHFAETLINNCMVQNARPDPFSARILQDAEHSLASLTMLDVD